MLMQVRASLTFSLCLLFMGCSNSKEYLTTSRFFSNKEELRVRFNEEPIENILCVEENDFEMISQLGNPWDNKKSQKALLERHYGGADTIEILDLYEGSYSTVNLYEGNYTEGDAPVDRKYLFTYNEDPDAIAHLKYGESSYISLPIVMTDEGLYVPCIRFLKEYDAEESILLSISLLPNDDGEKTEVDAEVDVRISDDIVSKDYFVATSAYPYPVPLRNGEVLGIEIFGEVEIDEFTLARWNILTEEFTEEIPTEIRVEKGVTKIIPK